ncbi:MAG: extracellular solute-binding protein [Mesorhizobium sp.]|nr:MAG: extracellular solute-binding protein [Mesorhizobium sp.]
MGPLQIRKRYVTVYNWNVNGNILPVGTESRKGGVMQYRVLARATLAFAIWSSSASARDKVEVWVVGEPGTEVVYDRLAARFNERHPQMELVLTKNTSDIFNPALVPALSSDEGPDLFMYGTGPGYPAAIISAGLVEDLTPYYRKYGWDSVIPEAIVDVTSANGKLWAVGNEVESTAMFYNRAIFDRFDLRAPTSWAELEQAVAKLKENGFETPIGLGAADKWPTWLWQSTLFGRYAKPAGVREVLFADGSWNGDAFQAAASRFQQMGQQGFFGATPVATGNAEIMEAFWAGRIPMTFSGTFALRSAEKSAGERLSDFGVFELPPMREGEVVYPAEGIGSGWYIRASSRHKDVAAEFLNFMFFSTEGRVELLNSGTLPVGPLQNDLPKTSMPQLAADLVKLVDRDRHNGTIYAYLDGVTPSNMITIAYDGGQALLLGEMSATEFVDQLEDAWREAKAKGEILKVGGIRN